MEALRPAKDEDLGDVSAVRAALASRVEACWDRFDDVVSELISVHDVSVAAIVVRAADVDASESEVVAANEEAL